jgi:Arc/MetJ family transcription regulator
MADAIGLVTGVSGAEMTVALDRRAGDGGSRVHIGALVKAATDTGAAVGIVSAIRTGGEGMRPVLDVDLLGEQVNRADGVLSFTRGVSVYPQLGTPVSAADSSDAELVYGRPESFHARIGTIYQDESRPAFLTTDDLLAKHFAIIGTTGSGKSCAVTLLLRALLGVHPCAHVILLDPHDEYSTAFGNKAEVLNVDNLELPCWLLNFEELQAVLVRGGTPEEQQAQASILKDAVIQARRSHAGQNAAANAWISVDTPVPFRPGDLSQIINETMGKLNKADTAAPFLRLRSRLESLQADRRYHFMFSGGSHDNMSALIGRLLRIPVAGKPLTIIDLSGLPSEITDVVVSLLFRMIFDFAVWSERDKMPPVLVVCEEAHRYVPADRNLGFNASTRAISRISKEGRKYGISLGLVTQRPSELSPTVLTQCSTLFALRMSNELDQKFIANALPDGLRGMLASLPSLRRQEAVVVGEGVSVPMRIRFDSLAPENRPRSSSAHFSRQWQTDSAGADFIQEGIRRWRRQMRDSAQSADFQNGAGSSRDSILRVRTLVANAKG